MRHVLFAVLTIVTLCSVSIRASAQAASDTRPTVIVVPPPTEVTAQAPSAAQQPPTNVVVVPPPADYDPNAAPRGRITERDESKYGYYPAPQLRPRFKSGMLITGLVILGSSYGVALTVGMSFAGGSCKKCQEIGIPLMVPVAGPFFAASSVKDGRGALIFLGVPQVIGAGLAIGGYYRYRNSKARAQADGYVVKLEDGKFLALDLSVNPAFVGPKLDLRF